MQLLQLSSRRSSDVFSEQEYEIEEELVEIKGGSTFAVGCTRDGRVLTWGSCFYGELGQNDKVCWKQMPISVALSVAVKSICAGLNHVVVISTEGVSYSWGSNSHGQLGRPSAKWTNIAEKISESTPSSVQAAAAGHQHTLLLQSNGKVIGFGSNAYGQIGADAIHLEKTPMSIAAGAFHSAILCRDGSVWTFGWGLYNQLGHDSTENLSQPQLVSALEGVGVLKPSGMFDGMQQVACGAWHTVALSSTGDVYAWGWNRDGQLGSDANRLMSSTLPHVVSFNGYFDTEDEGHSAVEISCGTRHTTVLCRNGDLLIWGPSSRIIHTSNTRVLSTSSSSASLYLFAS